MGRRLRNKEHIVGHRNMEGMVGNIHPEDMSRNSAGTSPFKYKCRSIHYMPPLETTQDCAVYNP